MTARTRTGGGSQQAESSECGQQASPSRWQRRRTAAWWTQRPSGSRIGSDIGDVSCQCRSPVSVRSVRPIPLLVVVHRPTAVSIVAAAHEQKRRPPSRRRNWRTSGWTRGRRPKSDSSSSSGTRTGTLSVLVIVSVDSFRLTHTRQLFARAAYSCVTDPGPTPLTGRQLAAQRRVALFFGSHCIGFAPAFPQWAWAQASAACWAG